MRKRKSPSFSTTTTKKTAQIIFSGFIFTHFFEVVQIQNLTAFILPFSFVEYAE